MKPERVTDNKSRQFAKESEPVKRVRQIRRIDYKGYEKLMEFLNEINKI